MNERVPQRYRAEVIRRIGHGGEATVYELTDGRVLRVYHREPHGANEIAAFYRALPRVNTSFALPQILEQGEEDGVSYSIDRLIVGRPLHELLPALTGERRAKALASYLDAAFEIASLPLVRRDYGEFLRDDDSIRAARWDEYLLARMSRSLAESPWLASDVPGLDKIAKQLAERIRTLTPEKKTLVHGDYFPGNVLMSDDLRVTGVIDFGPLTVIGDSRLDLASAVIFLEVARPGYLPSDTELLLGRLVERLGADILETVTTYRGWYAIRFSPYRDDDANLYAWCVEALRKVGEKFGT